MYAIRSYYAEAQQGALGPQMSGEGIPLGAAHGAQEYRVALLGRLQGLRRQGLPCLVDGPAAGDEVHVIEYVAESIP